MNTVVKFLFVIVGIIIAAIIVAFPIKWLWNWLMPDIFGLIKITVYQALGLSLLSGFFFMNKSGNDKSED